MVDDDPFESPKALIQGAVADITEFERASVAYVKSSGYSPVVQSDTKTGHQHVKLRVTRKPPPRMRYLSSNVLNNLRHSLDQAANASAVLLGKEKRDGYFPFARDVVGIEDVIKKRCRGFHPDLVSYLKAFQPYGGGDDFLYALGKVTGPNKHQITLNIECEAPTLEIRQARLTGPGVLGHIAWDKKKLELHIATLESPAARFELGIEEDAHLPLRIEISGSPSFAGQDATALLNAFASKVESIISAIEAESYRLVG